MRSSLFILYGVMAQKKDVGPGPPLNTEPCVYVGKSTGLLKLRKTDLSIVVQTDAPGAYSSIKIDGDYLYVANDNKVQKYLKYDLSFIIESLAIGASGVRNIVIDGDYIYLKGYNPSNRTVFYKLLKSDLSIIGNTASTHYRMAGPVIDGTYIYGVGQGSLSTDKKYFVKYLKSTLALSTSTAITYTGHIGLISESLQADDTYLYLSGGYQTNNIRKHAKSNAAFLGSASYYDTINAFSVEQTGSYLYIGGNHGYSTRIYKHLKSSMANVMGTADSANSVYGIIEKGLYLYVYRYSKVYKYLKSNMSYITKSLTLTDYSAPIAVDPD